MNLNIRKHFLRNSLRQQEEKLNLGIYFEIYTSRTNIYLTENQFECDDPYNSRTNIYLKEKQYEYDDPYFAL